MPGSCDACIDRIDAFDQAVGLDRTTGSIRSTLSPSPLSCRSCSTNTVVSASCTPLRWPSSCSSKPCTSAAAFSPSTTARRATNSTIPKAAKAICLVFCGKHWTFDRRLALFVEHQHGLEQWRARRLSPEIRSVVREGMACGAALKEPGVSREEIYDRLMALSDVLPETSADDE